jgi:hypothetical protein
MVGAVSADREPGWFPPDDGWCVRVASGDNAWTLQERVFDGRQEALNFGTDRAWHHRDERVWLIHRERGQTMHERELTMSHPPIDLEVWQELEILDLDGYEVEVRATTGNISVGNTVPPPPGGPGVAIRGANTSVFGGGGNSTATEAAKEALARWRELAPPDEPPVRGPRAGEG